MLVASYSAVTFAADEEGRTFELPEGLTVSLPNEFSDVQWVGMSESDSEFTAQYGLDPILDSYEEEGLALLGEAPAVGADDGQTFFVMVHVKDAPSDLSENTFIENVSANEIDSQENLESLEVLKNGVIHVGDKAIYKTCSDMTINYDGHARYKLRSNKYSFVSEAGKLYEIEIEIVTDPEKPDAAFTDEDLSHLDDLENYIIGSVQLDGKTVIISGESFDSDTMSREEGKSYTTLSGLTIKLPSDIEVFWNGISEDDPLFDKYPEMTMDIISQMYTQNGLELQAQGEPEGPDNGQFPFVFIHETDTPATPDEEALLDAFYTFRDEMLVSSVAGGYDGDPVEEQLGYGKVEIGGYTLFKVTSQVRSDYRVRFYEYTLISDSGEMHRIDVLLVSNPANHDEPIPFTEEDIAQHDALAEYVFESISYAGGTIAPEAEPFRVITGEPMGTVSGNNGDTSETKEEPAQTENTTTEPAAQSTAKKPKKTFFQSFTTFAFPIWLLACGMMLLLFLGAKVSKRHEWQEEPFSLETSKGIQGFAAVAIILHHLTQELAEKSGPLEFLSECGVLFVGIFFFFSGYGLYTSLKNKENYLKTFLKKRFVTILIPFYVCILVFTMGVCACGAKIKGKQIFYVLSGWSLINTHMWYIVEIAILYLVFYILYRLIKNRTIATILMTVFVLAMMGGSLWLCHGSDFACKYWFMGEWWYNASFLFIVGILVSKHADLLRKIARKAYVVLLPAFGVLTWFLGTKTRDALHTYSYWSEIPGVDRQLDDKLRCLSVQLPWIICFVIFLLLVMMKVRFGNPVLKFLGSISLELYLLHNLFLVGLSDGSIFRVPSPSMYMLLTVLMAIGLATVVSGFDKYVIALITGKKRDDLKLPETTPKRIASIDVMRAIMAFLVVAIHWPFGGKAGQVFITFGKAAVPFFLVVCGYLLFRENSDEMMQRLKKQTKRILIFFVLANVFYIGMYALYSHKMSGSWTDFKDCFKTKAIMNFLLYNFPLYSEHLWYLGSLLYALLILMLLNKLKVLKYAMYLAPALVAAYVVLAHMGVGEFYQLRNAIFIGLGYTMMGMLIRKYEKKILSIKHIGLILLVLFAACSFASIYELNHYKQGTAVPFIGAEIMTYVIVLLCLRFPNFGVNTFAEKFGRECSLPIYIMHIALIQVCLMTNNDKFFGQVGAFIIYAVTAAICAAYVSIKKAALSTREKTTA